MSSLGDSGGPYWRSEDIDTGAGEFEKRAVLLAISHGEFAFGDKYINTYDTDRRHQCKMISSKVSTKVIEWIRKILNRLRTPAGLPLDEF